MYSDRRGVDKNHPKQNLQTKDLWQNSRTKTPANNWERICTGGVGPGFCTRPTKNRRGPRFVTYFGGSGMCDKVWQGEGGQNWPKIAWRTFVDSPISALLLVRFYLPVQLSTSQGFLCLPPLMFRQHLTWWTMKYYLNA